MHCGYGRWHCPLWLVCVSSGSWGAACIPSLFDPIPGRRRADRCGSLHSGRYQLHSYRVRSPITKTAYRGCYQALLRFAVARPLAHCRRLSAQVPEAETKHPALHLTASSIQSVLHSLNDRPAEGGQTWVMPRNAWEHLVGRLVEINVERVWLKARGWQTPCPS